MVSAYLGKDFDMVSHIRTQIDKRHHVEVMIKHFREEQALASRLLKD